MVTSLGGINFTVNARLNDAIADVKKLSQAMADLTAQINHVTGPTQQQQEELDRLGKAYTKATDAVANFGQTMKANFTGNLMATAISMAVSELKQFGEYCVESAVKAERLTAAMTAVGRNAGYSAGEMEALRSSLKAMGTTTSGATEMLVNMGRTGLDLSKSTKLMAIAQDAAAVSGKDLNDAIHSISFGIEEHNTRVLKNIGIVFDSRKAYTDYAASIGKTVAGLTELERTTAIENAVEKNGATIAGAHAEALETVSGQYKELGIEGQKLAETLGEYTLPVLKEMIKDTRTLVSLGQQWLDWVGDS